MRKIVIGLTAVLLLSLLTYPAQAATTGTQDYLTYSIVDEEVTITDCDTAISGSIVVPDLIEGFPVTKIGRNAFSKCSELIRITLPDTVREIDDYAFSQSKALIAVDLPESLETIGQGAFYECGSLNEFVIPKNYGDFYAALTAGCPIEAYEVQEGSPYYCTDEDGVLYNKEMTMLIAYPGGRKGSYDIPVGVTTVARNAFFGSQISSVTFPDTLTTLRGGSFGQCQQLTDVVFTDNLTFIGEACFTDTLLTEVIIPRGVTELLYISFYANIKLERIILHSGITKIEEKAFSNNPALEEIVFFHTDQSELSIGAYAFEVQYPYSSSSFLTGSELSVYVPNTQSPHPSILAYNWSDTKRTANFFQIAGMEVSVVPTMRNNAGAVLTPPVDGWKEGTNTFSVSGDTACVVAVSNDGGNTYTRLKATATGTANTYQFTADNVTSDTIIEVQALGDVNGDGGFTNADVTMIRAVYAGKRTVDALHELAADVNGDGSFTNADITMMRAAYAGKRTLAW